MLKDQAKKEYMRRKRSNKEELDVRPIVLTGEALAKFLDDNNVGNKSGQHPFYGLRSTIFTRTES